MRNLKRALSLTLASVMLLGMMVVGSNAAGFPDVTEEDNVEAIEVLKAVEVMVGDDNGNFGPNDPVNRSQMAVVMAKLLNLDYQYYESSCIFWDVPTWARGYVGACYAKGIVSGYGGTTYGAADTVTAVQAASMMMRALGYFQNPEDYKGSFELATVSQGTDIGIFKGVGSSATAPMTRNQVAQMALNALRSEMVTFTGTPGVTVGDVTVGYRAEYTPRTSTESKYNAIEDRTSDVASDLNHKGQYYIQLGEELYDGKLKLRDDLDVFGRPSRKWEYDGKAIGAYAKKELLEKEYVGKVTGKDLYDLLGASTIKDYDLTVSLDGVSDAEIVRRASEADSLNLDYVFDKADLNRNNKAAVGNTGVGVQTEVYVDHEDDQIYVAVINTYLARATKAYDAKKEQATLNVYAVKKDVTSGEYVKTTKSDAVFNPGVEEFDIVKDIAKDESFLVTIADGELQSIKPAEILSAVSISAFKNQDYVVSGGTSYSYTTTAKFKDGDLDQYTGAGNNGITNLKDRTYNIYLDAYGNLIGLEEIDAVKNYVFISGIDLNGSNLINRTADVNAIFLDGTVATVKVNMTKSEIDVDGDIGQDALLNTWCTYTKNGDLYTLKEVYKAGDSKTQVTNGTPGAVADKNLGNTTSLAQFHQFNTDRSASSKAFDIDIKRLRLDGGGAASGSFRYVYGDSDSVYMTAELGELKMPLTAAPGNYAIIKDVETLSTGIADTSVNVFTREAVINATDTNKVEGVIVDSAYGVYTLYDKDGTVIAAMIVGEGSSAKDLVYAHTGSLDLESDNGGANGKAANDGLWTWTRRVIRDGEEVTLTEVGDASEELIKMDQYHWYEVKTNGDGEVIKVTPADEALYFVSGTYDEDKIGRNVFVSNYTVLNDVVEEDSVDTVLYQTEAGPNAANSNGFGQNKGQTLEVKGNNTLAVSTIAGSGIHFRNDVNVVLQYWNRNTKEIDILAGEGVDDLKEMVDIVNDNTAEGRDNFTETYYISALIRGGLATDIVIWDSYNTYHRGPVTTRDMVQIDLKMYPTTENEFLLNHELITKGQYRISGDVLYIYAAEGDVVSVHKIDRFEGDIFDEDDLALLNGHKAGSAGISNYGRTLTFTVGAKVVTLGNFDVKHDDVTITITGDANVTVEGKPFTGGKVPYGTEITVTPVGGYTTTVNGVKVEVVAKYTVTEDMTIVATKDEEPIDPDKDVTVTFKGTAISGNHYSVKGLEEGKIVLKAGQELTITANKRIAVYEGDERSEMVAKETKTITAKEDITIVINRFKVEFIGDVLGEVEKTDEDTPEVPAMASMAAYARTGDVFVKISLEGEGAPNKTYVVKVVSGGYQFGKDTTAEMRAEIVDAIEKADLADTDIEIIVEDEEVTEDEIAAWKGEQANTYTLTLAGLLASSAIKEGPTVSVWIAGKDGYEVEGKQYVDDNGKTVVDYAIPDGASVQVKCVNGKKNLFDRLIPAGALQKGYLFGETYVMLQAGGVALGDNSVTLNFAMGEDVVLNLFAKDTLIDEAGVGAKEMYLVTSHDGVTVELTKGDEKVELGANESTYIEAGTYSIKVTDAGEGKYVSNSKIGMSDSVSTWTENTTATGYMINKPLDLYSGVKVTALNCVISTTDGTGVSLGGSTTPIFVGVGQDIKVRYTTQFTGAEATSCDYLMVIESDVPANWLAEEGDDNLIADGETYRFDSEEDVTIRPAVSFTLGAGVKATLTNWDDAAQGTVSAIEGAPSVSAESETTCYVAGVEVNSKNTKLPLQGLVAVKLEAIDDENQAVVEPKVADGMIDMIGGWADYYPNVTAYYITAATVYPGVRWEAWTKLSAAEGLEDLEGYINDLDHAKAWTVFDNVDEIPVDEQAPKVVPGAAYTRAVSRIAKTIFVNPEWEQEILIVVPDANQKGLNVTGCEVGEVDDHPWVQSQYKNAYGYIRVGTEKVTIDLNK